MNLRLLIFFLLVSCDNGLNKTSPDEIRILINSGIVDKIIEGNFIIGEEKQTIFIKDLLFNAHDNRISHHYRFKGISVFQSKMIALKKISGLNPPNIIKSESDSTIIKFYYSWALKNKYIKNAGNVPN